MKKIAPILMILFLLRLTLSAQESTPAHHLELPGAAEVSSVNGAPNITIPIWTLSCGNLNLPVYLQYNVNGVRINESPGRAGMSWKLNTGGMIIQNVRGLNDFSNPLDYKSIDSIAYDSRIHRNLYYEDIVNGTENSEPDIFYFNAGDLSGSFFFDADGKIHTEYNGHTKIIYTERTKDGKFDDYFTVISDIGTKYTFEYASKQLYWDENGLKNDYAYIWYLSKIESPDNVYSIDLHYTRSDTLCYGKTVTYIEPKTFVSVWLTKKTEPITPLVLLDRITTSENNQTLIFDYTQSDFAYSNHFTVPFSGKTYYDQFIKSVSVKNSESTTVKKVEFDYNQNTTKKRAFLRKLTIRGKNNTLSDSYLFNYYYPDNLPSLYNTSFDFWGYYNGNTSTLYAYANRFPDSTKTYFGMLKEIYFPGGGYGKYSYEPNRYEFPSNTSDPYYESVWAGILSSNNNNTKGPGVRISKTETYERPGTNAKITEYEYKTEEGTSSGRLNYYPYLDYTVRVYPGIPAVQTVYSVDPMTLEASNLTYTQVTVYQGGKTTYGENTAGVNGSSRMYFYEPARYKMYGNEKNWLISNGMLNSLPVKSIVTDRQNKVLTKSINYFPDSLFTDKYSKGIRVRTDLNNYINDTLDEYRIDVYKLYQKNIRVDSAVQYTTESTGTDTIGSKQFTLYSRINPQTSELENYKLPVMSYNLDSKGDTLKTILSYPTDFVGDEGVFDKMIERNMINSVIKKENFKNDVQLSGSRTLFKYHITASGDTLIVPDYMQVYENGDYVTVQWFDVYNDKGKLLESHGIDGIHNCTLYGYPERMPVATISNATYSEIDFALSKYAKEILADPSSDIELRNILNALRKSLPNAYISSATYKPLIGKTSETDADSLTTYYEYDDLGRLTAVYNDDMALLKSYAYNTVNKHYTYPLKPISELYLSPGSSVLDTFYFQHETVEVKWDTLIYTKEDHINVDFQMIYPQSKTITLAENSDKFDGVYSFVPEEHDSISSYDLIRGKFIVSVSEAPSDADTSTYTVQIKVCPWLTFPLEPVSKSFVDTLNVQWEPAYISGYTYYDIKFIPTNINRPPVTIATNVNKNIGRYLWDFDLSAWERYRSVLGKIRISAHNNAAVYEESALISLGYSPF